MKYLYVKVDVHEEWVELPADWAAVYPVDQSRFIGDCMSAVIDAHSPGYDGMVTVALVDELGVRG